MTFPDTEYKSSNYSNSDLVKIFPVTSFYYIHFTGGNSFDASRGTVELTTDYDTTNYAVFSSIYYGFSGSDGTYDDNSTSAAVKTMVIYDIKKTYFKWVFSHGTSENLNIYVVFMVVFNSDLDYDKSY